MRQIDASTVLDCGSKTDGVERARNRPKRHFLKTDGASCTIFYMQHELKFLEGYMQFCSFLLYRDSTLAHAGRSTDLLKWKKSLSLS